MYKAFNLAGSALLLAGCAATQPSSIIPQKLNPSAGESMTMLVPAKGVQIYECRIQQGQPGAYEWRSSRPTPSSSTPPEPHRQALAGPHWEAADGSKVVAKRSARPRTKSVAHSLAAAREVGLPTVPFSRSPASSA